MTRDGQHDGSKNGRLKKSLYRSELFRLQAERVKLQ